MRFTIERAPLLKALNHLNGVVERRGTTPVLSNVLIRADGESLSLSATDMDIELIERVPATVAKPGATTAPAKTLYDIVRKLRDGSKIKFSLERDLAVYSGKSRFSLTVISEQDYLTMAAGEIDTRFKIPAADLCGLIDRTRFAISTEETRYYLNGVYLSIPPDEAVLRAVATDGHRLARADVTLPDGAAGMPGIIVPRKTVLELRKLIGDADGDLYVAVSKTKIQVATATATMTSKLIDGTFPEYQRVIPAGNDKTLEVIREDFASAVDRVATIDEGKTRAVKMAMDGGNLTLSSSNPAHGSAVEEIEARYTSPPIEIGFNSRYLRDIAQQIGGEAIRFDLADAGGPVLIRDAADPSALYVLMPMRV